MQRYVALVWDATERAECAVARLIAVRLHSRSHTWVRVLDCSGLIVLHARGLADRTDVYAFAGQAGVVLGQLFTRTSETTFTPAAAQFDEEEADRIRGSGARHLLEHYWGRYVAVIHDEVGATRVLRDPTGALPCFTTLCHRVRVFFSDVEDLLGLGLFTFSLNWSHIVRTVVLSVTHVRTTGLNEVSEIQPGECIELRGGSVSRSQLWNPAAIADSTVLEDAGSAASRLGATVAACVRAWASRH